MRCAVGNVSGRHLGKVALEVGRVDSSSPFRKASCLACQKFSAACAPLSPTCHWVARCRPVAIVAARAFRHSTSRSMRGPMHTAPVPRRRAATIQSDVFIHTTFTDRRYWSQRWPGPERLKAESHQLLDRAHPGRSILAKSLVPLAGLEPARCCHHLILSQARLPIPPQGQAGGIIAAKREGSTGPHVLSVSLLSSRSLIRSSGPWVPGLAVLARDTRERTPP